MCMSFSVTDYARQFSLCSCASASHLAHPWFAILGAAAAERNVDCILNCDQESITVCLSNAEAYLHLPMVVRIRAKIEQLTF